MRGTVIGNWVAATFPKELLALKPEDMPPNSHWEAERARQCDGACKDQAEKALFDAIAAEKSGDEITALSDRLPKLPEDCFECPTCKGPTRASRDGKRIDDGRYFYGLTFHDPNYDPGKAVIGQDCTDRTLTKDDTGSEGKTVEQAEEAGNSFGLERYQAFYSASSKQPTERHTVPLIDGACGVESVMRILNAIGLTLRKVHDSSKLDVYVIEEAHEERQEIAA